MTDPSPITALGLDLGRQPVLLGDLRDRQQQIVRLRYAHLMEAETGYRSGEPLRPEPGEPRPGYDPTRTTVGQRRMAKVAELAARGRDEAAAVGLARVSTRTLQRWAAACRRSGMLGCADGHWTRASGGHPSITPAVRDAIEAVRAQTLHRSRLSMRSRQRLMAQYLAERHGTDVALPSYWTLRRVWREWFGPGGTRQRYVRTAAVAPPLGGRVTVDRPGQVVALDTTVLPVKVRETVFGEPVSVHLTLAADVYTHSILGFRLTLVSDTSVDVAMLLRDVMTPKRLRRGWGPDMAWAYPGLPPTTVDRLAGYRVAAVPFLTPETVTVDHGAVYKNHHLVEVQRVLGVNILPARVLRPTDKHTVERTFGAVQSLLWELLPGWQGIDVADRGTDPEADATLTITQIEDLFAGWIVRVWQNRILEGYAPAWDLGGSHSPNSLFAAALGQGGFAAQIPPPDLYYPLLPATNVAIHGRRGVKVRGLWYDGDVLDPYRCQRSTRGGRHPGSWVVHYDRRDVRQVFFQDPHDHTWHTLPWTGLPVDGEMPAFGDLCRDELLRRVREAGLAPRSDQELLPDLLTILGDTVPVDQWPNPRAGRRRRQARDVLRSATAATDRPRTDHDGAPLRDQLVATDAALPWAERAAGVQAVVDTERRRRREGADTPDATPARVGEQARRHSLLVLPESADEPCDDGPGSGDDR